MALRFILTGDEMHDSMTAGTILAGHATTFEQLRGLIVAIISAAFALDILGRQR
jgi:hypothetical protein